VSTRKGSSTDTYDAYPAASRLAEVNQRAVSLERAKFSLELNKDTGLNLDGATINMSVLGGGVSGGTINLVEADPEQIDAALAKIDKALGVLNERREALAKEIEDAGGDPNLVTADPGVIVTPTTP
jgi:hypothetical protein